MPSSYQMSRVRRIGAALTCVAASRVESRGSSNRAKRPVPLRCR